MSWYSILRLFNSYCITYRISVGGNIHGPTRYTIPRFAFMVDISTFIFLPHILMLLSLNNRFFGSLVNHMLISLKSRGFSSLADQISECC